MREVYYVVDLGTTTIDTSIIDKATREELYRGSIKNPQSLYGSDVMNRILTIQRDSSYRKELSNMVKKVLLCELTKWFTINELCKLNSVCVTGNTTMIAILLEKDVSSMAAYPFVPAIKDSVTLVFDEVFNLKNIIPDANIDFELLSSCIDTNCSVFLTGCISAFLGGDIIAGIKYIEKKYETDSYLFLDLGTNGEMILCVDGSYYGTSTACGPAFEGCTRSQKVFGNTVLDAICLARKLKKIDEYGIIKDNSSQDNLDMNGVYINAEILRQIMLAKAAIVAGYYCLLECAGVKVEAINHLYIAGGFGFHMNIDNAVFLGMIPSCLKDKITVLGNTSLEGGKEILFDETLRQDFDGGFVKRVKVCDLTEEETFKQMLINQCKFAPL